MARALVVSSTFLCLLTSLPQDIDMPQDILMLSVGTTLGAVQGVVTHFDYTVNWRKIQITRYEQSQKPYYDETAMFGKADTGWRSVFSWIGELLLHPRNVAFEADTWCKLSTSTTWIRFLSCSGEYHCPEQGCLIHVESRS